MSVHFVEIFFEWSVKIIILRSPEYIVLMSFQRFFKVQIIKLFHLDPNRTTFC